MKKFTEIGESIESIKALLGARKPSLSSHLILSGIGGCFKYSLKKNAKALILKELNPKKYKYKETSHLDLDDCLVGNKIEAYSVKKPNFKKISNYSSSHGYQESKSSNTFAYAEIAQPFRNVLEGQLTKKVS